MTDITRETPGPSSARSRLARSYIRWLRRRNPEASPAQIVALLEKHYLSSVMAAGALVSAGTLAASVGVAMMPLPGSSKTVSAGARTGKSAARVAVRRASKIVAFRGVRRGAERAAMMLPAGDQQLQFELTTLFGLALAEIHGLALDKEQSDILVYGLSNRRLSQSQIAQLAAELVRSDPEYALAVGGSSPDQWTSLLAGALPEGAAQQLLLSIQGEDIYPVADALSEKQQAGVEYGIAAVAGGASKFAFGKDVVAASRHAFPDPPDHFPKSLNDEEAAEEEVGDLENAESALGPKESRRALKMLKEGATGAGSWVKRGAAKVVRRKG